MNSVYMHALNSIKSILNDLVEFEYSDAIMHRNPPCDNMSR